MTTEVKNQLFSLVHVLYETIHSTLELVPMTGPVTKYTYKVARNAVEAAGGTDVVRSDINTY